MSPAIRLAALLTTASLIPGIETALGQGNREQRITPSPEIARRAEELFREALTLTGIREGEPRLLLREAVDLWVQMCEPERAARASLQLGDSYSWEKEFQESLYCYKQALEMASVPVGVKATAFCSIAEVYAELYHHDLALHYYERSFELARDAKDVSTQVRALDGLAALHYQAGKMEPAIECIAKARELNPERNEHAEAASLHLSGLIAQERGDMERARTDIEGALEIYRRSNNQEGEVRSLCSIANLDLACGRTEAALRRADEAVKIAESRAERALSNADKLRAREMRWRAWLSLGRVQRELGEKGKAKTSYIRAASNLEGIWWLLYVLTDRSAVAFGEERRAVYPELLDLLVELGDLENAFYQTEWVRSRAISGSLQARRKDGASKFRQTDAIRELHRSLATLRTRSFSPKISLKQRAKIQAEIKAAEIALEEARVMAQMDCARDCLVWSPPANVAQVQKTIVAGEEAVLTFFLGEKRSFAWLISSNGIHLEILRGRLEIENAVRKYLDLINTQPSNLYIGRDLTRFRESAPRLFSMLFGDLSRQLPSVKSLIIVPDGVLHYLPFDTLVSNGRVLIEDHEISYVPSASLLSLLRAPRRVSGPTERMELLALGDPSFGPDSVVSEIRDSSGFSLGRLPATQDEVQSIADLFPLERRHVYVGKSSTEDAIKRETLRRFRLIHFATHSLLDERYPSRSAVVFTIDDDPQEDGFLEVSEIAELDLNCDLVVLSACQTARGQLLSGEGIVGLSRAFLYAGARSVVVSLWNVSDISTGRLMKSFYKDLTGSSGNAAALRQAKLQMLHSGRETRHPYYWAPFILVGKP